MKKLIIIIIVLAAAGGFYYWRKHRPAEQETTFYRSQPIARGTVVQDVTATGTISPITKVEVATQVTGKVISLSADYNSKVTEGQVIAIIDPDNYKSQLASARAQLKSNQASLEKTLAQLRFTEKELERLKKLNERGMATDSELDSMQASYDQLLATEKSNQAAIEQSEASVKTAENNLSYCTITSPVTGVVITRAVDEGQTVVSSMNASALFTIATDLSAIKVEASIPEADIGEIKVGQTVNFTVDAYKDKFVGKVTQIRLSSTTTSNVVTYPVIVEAVNEEEKLFPGMTANLAIVIAENKDVVTVPAAALRFTPPDAPARPPMGMAAGDSAPEAASPEQQENMKTIWIADSDTEIHPVQVKLGISDGITQALVGSEELLDKRVVTGKQSAGAAKRAADQPSNPFMPKRPGSNNKKGGSSRG